MPELPEVETVRRGLAPVMEGAVITRADVNRPDLRWPFPEQMAERLTGVKVERLRRRSKYILADLSSGETLLIHLGMSGRLEILDKETPPKKHDHVDITFHNSKNILRYTDPRRFGSIFWIDGDIKDHFLISRLGPEPLESLFTGDYLFSKAQNKKSPIKNIIMDSHIVVGVGNIYASESLFKAGVIPSKLGKDTSLDECTKIVKHIKATLIKAIELGGSSLKDFYNVNGQSGYFQQTYNVYGMKGKPCRKCKSIIENIKIGQRSSFFCIKCQN